MLPRIAVFAGTAALLITACTGPDAYPVQEIGTVAVTLDRGQCPTRVGAVVTVGMGACERLVAPDIDRNGGEIYVNVLAESTMHGDACISALLSGEVSVDLGPLLPGSYRLIAAGELNTVVQPVTVPPCR